MASTKMHSDEIHIDEETVAKLIADQFPQWAHLPLSPITPAGTDNAMFRLGDELAVRLPRTERAAANIEKECRWLPEISPNVSLPIPTPIQQGKPQGKYPLPWAICRSLRGKNLSVSSLSDLHQVAVDMGSFVAGLHKIDAKSGPKAKRGLPLHSRDEETRNAIAQLDSVISKKYALHFWNDVLSVPQWSGRATWFHGDLHPGNLLVENNRISAVIDFGSCGVGDPACDLMFAWTVLDPKSRDTFRSIVKPDDNTWRRGRGWAFTMGIVAYPYYLETNPIFAAVAKRAVEEVLQDKD